MVRTQPVRPVSTPCVASWLAGLTRVLRGDLRLFRRLASGGVGTGDGGIREAALSNQPPVYLEAELQAVANGADKDL